jgi:hypothetical protein
LDEGCIYPASSSKLILGIVGIPETKS